MTRLKFDGTGLISIGSNALCTVEQAKPKVGCENQGIQMLRR